MNHVKAVEKAFHSFINIDMHLIGMSGYDENINIYDDGRKRLCLKKKCPS